MAKNKNNFTFYSQDWQSSQTLLGTNPEERAIFFELIIKAHQEDNQIVEDFDVWSRTWNIKKRRLLSVLSQLVEKKMIEKRGKTWYVPSVQRRIKARLDGLDAYNKKLEKQNNLKGGLKGGASTQDIRDKIEDINNKIQDIPKEVSNCDWFIESWNKSLVNYKKAKAGDTSFLTKVQKKSISELLEMGVEIDDIRKSIAGLMMQKKFPGDGNLVYITHLLKNEGEFVQKYLAAYNSNNKEIYGVVEKFE